MTPELEKVRDDKAAELSYTSDGEEYFSYTPSDFKQGFNFAIAHLEKQAGEFAPYASRDSSPYLEADKTGAWIGGAREQFEQVRAAWGLDKLRIIAYKVDLDEAEARLAESERLRADYEHECETIKEMKDKLTKAEANLALDHKVCVACRRDLDARAESSSYALKLKLDAAESRIETLSQLIRDKGIK